MNRNQICSKMTTKFIYYTFLFLLCYICTKAQVLKPGFDASEYEKVLQRCSSQSGNPLITDDNKQPEFKRKFRSKEAGLHNRWDLWVNNTNSIIAIDIRGTVNEPDSWLENFYSPMIPAIGIMQIDSDYSFNYKLAADPKAMVHAGWVLGLGSMAREITEKIRNYYGQGVKQIIVEGHSQGGAIAFLLSSYLHYQIADGRLPADLVIKTYCSAAPKPGNLYYAYDYDYINRGGWAFTVVNAADWVPETPFTMQTLPDINRVNPFLHTNDVLKKQPLFVRLYLNHIYRRLTHTSFKAQRKYEKYLGYMAAKRVRKYLPFFDPPPYTHSGNYMRAGNAIVLQPDDEYYKLFPQNSNNIFVNHLFQPYYYLLKKEYR